MSKILYSNFSDIEPNIFSKGKSILGGDANGYLVLNRDLALSISKFFNDIPYIYSVSDGDLNDFIAIKKASGFFTN